MNYKWLTLVAASALLGACAPAQMTAPAAPAMARQTVQIASPLSRAHAHNDYEHDRPLLNALAQGFTSVEADVYLQPDGALLVAHEPQQVRTGRTLQSLYLEPLRQIAAQNGGHIYPGQSLTLYIDVKTDAAPTYAAIDKVLAPYADLLTRYENGRVTPGAVTVVISGNRVPEVMAAQPLRYAGMDGRLSDLGGPAPASLIPIISNNFIWQGTGDFPANERQKLENIVRTAHANGQRLRFWATPETPAMWQLLTEVGVDQINTDDLSGLRSYLLQHDPAAHLKNICSTLQ